LLQNVGWRSAGFGRQQLPGEMRQYFYFSRNSG
jgi:hypothetical protein